MDEDIIDSTADYELYVLNDEHGCRYVIEHITHHVLEHQGVVLAEALRALKMLQNATDDALSGGSALDKKGFAIPGVGTH